MQNILPAVGRTEPVNGVAGAVCLIQYRGWLSRQIQNTDGGIAHIFEAAAGIQKPTRIADICGNPLISRIESRAIAIVIRPMSELWSSILRKTQPQA